MGGNSRKPAVPPVSLTCLRCRSLTKYNMDMLNKFKACGVATVRSVHVVLICAVIVGCGDEPGATAHVAPPSHDKQMLAQPQLDFADRKSTLQGTAFFVRAPNGQCAAVTASHYLDQHGPALVHVWFLSVPAAKATPLADSTVCWGSPGDNGIRGRNDITDLRTDRFVLSVSVDEQQVHVLDLDDRPAPDIRESVWFPDKQPGEPGGFRLIGGKVVQIERRFLRVRLDNPITPQSQSGSQVISQVNGRVVGLWAGVTQDQGTTFLFLNPAREIHNALEDPSRPTLSHVVGKARTDDPRQ